MIGHGRRAGMTLKLLAEQGGRLTYHGTRCAVCGQTERYVSNEKCKTCQKARNVGKRPVQNETINKSLIDVANNAFDRCLNVR